MKNLKVGERLQSYQVSATPVLIRPDQLVPLAAIRPVKITGTDKLFKLMQTNGWMPSSFVFVRLCEPALQGTAKEEWGVIDGMHRLGAALRMIKKKEWTQDHKVL